MVALLVSRCVEQLEGRASCDACGPLSACATEPTPSCFVVTRSRHRCMRAPLAPPVPPDTITRAIFGASASTPAPPASEPPSDPLLDPSHEPHGCESSHATLDPSHEPHGCESSHATLGNLWDIVRTSKECGDYQRVTLIEKRQLEDLQRRISRYTSQKNCGVVPIPHEHLIAEVNGAKSRWLGMQTCKRKTCVKCHLVGRRPLIQESDQLLHEIIKRHGSLVMLTFTSSNRGIDLLDQMEMNQKTLNKVFKRRAVERLLTSMGYVGVVRGTEIQINTGTRTFHPHMHLALAFRAQVSEEQIEELRGLLRQCWCETIAKAGGVASTEQQIVERAQDSASGQYVAKGAAEEIGLGAIKEGKHGSVSWYGLLWKILWADEDGDVAEREALIALYQEFEKALHNKRLIAVSSQLREYVEGLKGEEQEEACEPEPEEAPHVEPREGECTRIVVPHRVYYALKSLGIAHIVPLVLASRRELIAPFERECAREQLVRVRRRSTEELRRDLKKLFDGIADRSVWELNEALGLYDPGRRKGVKVSSCA